MPSPPPDKPEPAPEPVAANPPQPKPAEPERPQPRGDLALAKPTPAPEPTPAEPAPRPRARTLVEARTRQGLMTGEKMRQEGGVRRRALMSSLDVKATPFGAYDAAVIAAIQKRWYDLLDESSFAPRTGKVAIEFRMHYDGRITDLKIVEVEPGVGELLALYCRRAISDPAPFAPWPSDMRRMIGRDYRDVKFSFFYL
jgi:outer membrane biosynthesis protein TonB